MEFVWSPLCFFFVYCQMSNKSGTTITITNKIHTTTTTTTKTNTSTTTTPKPTTTTTTTPKPTTTTPPKPTPAPTVTKSTQNEAQRQPVKDQPKAVPVKESPNKN